MEFILTDSSIKFDPVIGQLSERLPVPIEVEAIPLLGVSAINSSTLESLNKEKKKIEEDNIHDLQALSEYVFNLPQKVDPHSGFGYRVTSAADAKFLQSSVLWGVEASGEVRKDAQPFYVVGSRKIEPKTASSPDVELLLASQEHFFDRSGGCDNPPSFAGEEVSFYTALTWASELDAIHDIQDNKLCTEYTLEQFQDMLDEDVLVVKAYTKTISVNSSVLGEVESEAIVFRMNPQEEVDYPKARKSLSNRLKTRAEVVVKTEVVGKKKQNRTIKTNFVEGGPLIVGLKKNNSIRRFSYDYRRGRIEDLEIEGDRSNLRAGNIVNDFNVVDHLIRLEAGRKMLRHWMGETEEVENDSVTSGTAAA